MTSASPIISADAVEAVRAGLRAELPSASSPAEPPIFVAGQPSTRTSGGTSFGANIEKPMNSATAPMPSASSRSPGRQPADQQADEHQHDRADERRRRPRTCRTWPSRDGGSSEPSRAAAIGGTRVARSAGRSAASIVMMIPTSSETTIVRVLNTVDAWGRLIPNDTSSEFERLGQQQTEEQPDDRRERRRSRTPRPEPSGAPDDGVAPSVRSVASSRVRCAIVIDSVLAITKLPTNRAMPPNASRKSWKMLRNPLVSLVACWACC